MTILLAFILVFYFLLYKMDRLEQLEIKILFRLYEKTSLSKTALNKCFWYINKRERKYAINNLILDHFIAFNKIPKPKVKKTPTYYFITEKGEAWTNNYIKNMPL